MAASLTPQGTCHVLMGELTNRLCFVEELFCPVLYILTIFEHLHNWKVGKLVLENPIPAGTG